MIFKNSPFEILDKAFKSLYPDKEYIAFMGEHLEDEEGKPVFGYTEYLDGEKPVITIDAGLTIKDATEIFAHELAHVAAGMEAEHGEKWEREFDRIHKKYTEIGEEMFKGGTWGNE